MIVKISGKKKEEKSLGFDSKDFDDIKFNPNWSRMDCLVAVAERASYLLKQRMIAKEKRIDEEDNHDHFKKLINPRFLDPEIIKQIPKQKKIIKIKMKDRKEIRKRGRSSLCRASTPAAAADDDQDDQEHQEKSEEEEEGNRNKRQKTKKNTAGASSSSSSYSPELPQEYMTVLERFAAGKRIQELNFVLSKHIYKTDISPTHSRLSLPKKNNKQEHSSSFLTEEENYLKLFDLNEKDKKVLNSMEVDVIDPCLEICKLELKNWAISKGMYVLTKYWNNLVERNSIQVNQTIEVWIVRVDQKLCFILVRVPEAAAQQQQDNGVV